MNCVDTQVCRTESEGIPETNNKIFPRFCGLRNSGLSLDEKNKVDRQGLGRAKIMGSSTQGDTNSVTLPGCHLRPHIRGMSEVNIIDSATDLSALIKRVIAGEAIKYSIGNVTAAQPTRRVEIAEQHHRHKEKQKENIE
ncbi:MAG: hypothetical protein ACI8W8_001399 [Rhodothermales bacterium]